MADKKTKVQMPGLGMVDGVELTFESTERWTEVKLSDGTTLRTKPVILGVVRVEGHYDADGNPLYALKANAVMTADVPEHLKKGASASSKAH